MKKACLGIVMYPNRLLYIKKKPVGTNCHDSLSVFRQAAFLPAPPLAIQLRLKCSHVIAPKTLKVDLSIQECATLVNKN